MRRRIAPFLVLALLLTLLTNSLFAASLQQKPLDGAELQLALKKLTVLGSVLYVAAHPDDENTAFIAWASRDRLYRTGYLAMTRGDGGQNLIGDEKGELLGVIRTQELLAARRIDGGEQFFTRAVDFGFSKGPEETLKIWDHDKILSDVVFIFRRFRPDVVVMRFPTTGEGGHGHHTASAILAREAFTAAIDPSKFMGLLAFNAVWEPKRLFWNRFSWTPIKPDDPSVAKSLRLDLGAYNPLIGRAYTEIAAESRSQHKSQGFGAAERRGTLVNYFDQLDGEPATSDLFEGIDTSWSRYPGGEAVGKLLGQASDTFDPQHPSRSIPLLLQAWTEMDRLGARPEWNPRVNPWLEVKRAELLEAVRGCAGLSIDISAADSSVIPGGELPVSVTVVNRSDFPFTLSMVASPYANPGKAPGTKLLNNVPVKTDITVKLPSDQPYSQPYWLQQPAVKGTFTVTNQELVGRPDNPPAVPITVTLDDNQQHTLVYTLPAVYRWTDPVKGEQLRAVDVVPEVTANLGSRVYLFPDTKPRPVTVWLQNFTGAVSAKVRLVLPAGWSAEPAIGNVKFEKKGDEARVTFRVTPQPDEATGYVAVQVELPDGRKLSMGLTNIDYPHIPAQRVFGDSAGKLVRVNVKRTGTKVGYIMGSGDEVAEALRQMGYEVTSLTDADLERGDFSAYDAVVVGVRAYNTRKRLRFAQERLMKYVQDGGTVVVQYNTTDETVVENLGPYPFKISRDRVTVEEAPVRFVDPAHPLLNVPNKISQDDFKGWVQERGLNFTANWDARYTTILSSNDPGESEKPGGELFVRYGKGAYVYTSYSWFRQLPAGVPGAYKLFANLVSAK